MQTEIWKDVKGYEGFYQVSNLGNFKSLTRKVKQFKRFVMLKGKTIKPVLKTTGYSYVNLYKNGNLKQLRCHRVAYESFVGEIKEGYVIDHINNKKSDNRLINLQMITYRENSQKDQWRWNRSSKYLGVQKRNGKFIAQLRINCKTKNIGTYDNELEAKRAYDDFIQKNNIQ